MGSSCGDARLANRLGLAGECGIVRAQFELLDQTRIGRYGIALFEDHEIAGNQFGGRDLHGLPIPDDSGIVRNHLLEGFGGLLSAELLPEGEDRVDEDDCEDRPSELGHPADEREDAADPEHDGEQVVEVLEELQDERAALDLANLVATVLFEPLGRLLRGQALSACTQRFVELVAGFGPTRVVHAECVVLCHRLSSPHNRKKTVRRMRTLLVRFPDSLRGSCSTFLSNRRSPRAGALAANPGSVNRDPTPGSGEM